MNKLSWSEFPIYILSKPLKSVRFNKLRNRIFLQFVKIMPKVCGATRLDYCFKFLNFFSMNRLEVVIQGSSSPCDGLNPSKPSDLV